MALHFLGGDTGNEGSPRLYEDGPDLLVQGYLLLYRPDGRADGFYAQDDPGLAGRYRAACEQAWARAIPYADYVGCARRQ